MGIVYKTYEKYGFSTVYKNNKGIIIKNKPCALWRIIFRYFYSWLIPLSQTLSEFNELSRYSNIKHNKNTFSVLHIKTIKEYYEKTSLVHYGE